MACFGKRPDQQSRFCSRHLGLELHYSFMSLSSSPILPSPKLLEAVRIRLGFSFYISEAWSTKMLFISDHHNPPYTIVIHIVVIHTKRFTLLHNKHHAHNVRQRPCPSNRRQRIHRRPHCRGLPQGGLLRPGHRALSGIRKRGRRRLARVC